MKKFTVKKLDDGSFSYRGVEFERYDDLRGYSGHYRTWGRSRISAATRKELLASIDHWIEQRLKDKGE